MFSFFMYIKTKLVVWGIQVTDKGIFQINSCKILMVLYLTANYMYMYLKTEKGYRIISIFSHT